MGEIIEELHSTQNELEALEVKLEALEDYLREKGLTTSEIEEIKNGKDDSISKNSKTAKTTPSDSENY